MTQAEAALKVSKSLAKLIMAGMLVQLAVIVYVAYATSQWHDSLVQSQRDGCERIKLDRVANARGWRIAEDARRATGDEAVALRYGKLADSLEERSEINCRVAYP